MSEFFNANGMKQQYLPDPPFQEYKALGDYKDAYADFLADPVNFWSKKAEELSWMRKWDSVRVWNHPYARWFEGAKLNITVNCLDRHIRNGRKNKLALIWIGEDGEEQALTYRQLYRSVMRFANALKRLGVRKGDRIVFYLPLIPEEVVAVLASARIGAVHSIVYTGFGSEVLSSRIRDAGAKVVITADIGRRRGKTIPLKRIVDEAVRDASCVEKVILVCREKCSIELYSDREVDFSSIQEGVDDYCPPEVMDAEDLLFILYTCDTTGSQKGIVHTCAGYMVGTHYTSKDIFDIRENDLFWCTADPGWITGHSYIIYGPLSVGATVVITETTPDYPDYGLWWSIIEEFRISLFYTAPTVIRMFMEAGEEWPGNHDLSSLRIIGSVGEPLNPEAFEWYYRVIGKGRCPVLDTWWQTETGMHMITTPPGQPMKPGFAGVPIPGVVADVVDDEGNPVPPGRAGFLVIREPWPAMMRTVYHNDKGYRDYWTRIKNYYCTKDLAVRDGDGYIRILGRSDEVIIVAGYNLGAAEVESALSRHESVAEAAVIGIPDRIRGQAVKAFVTLVQGCEPDRKLVSELMYHVRMSIGPIAMPAAIEFVEKLPKTVNGEINRNILKPKGTGLDPGEILLDGIHKPGDAAPG